MERSIEQALSSLVPAFNSSPPEALVNLATALLAQSRTRASNLRNAEEIARVYVCAHMACERLKRALDIPPYTVRPPCPPRIYNKLYKYFHQVLEVKVSRPRAAKVSNGDDLVPVSSKTPSRPTSIETRGIPKSKDKQQQPQDESNVETHIPEYVTSLVERLCTEVMDATAARLVFAGVNAVLTLSPPCPPKDAETPKEPLKDKVAALAIAVCFYVQARIYGGQAAAKDLTARRKAAVDIANNSPDKGSGNQKIKDEDVELWMHELHSRGWLKLPWFTGIDSDFTSRSTTGSEDEDDSLGRQVRSLGSVDHEEQDDDDGSEPLRPMRKRRRLPADSSQRQSWRKEIVEPGLNTMMQPKLDFLSSDYKADYRTWEDIIFSRISDSVRMRLTGGTLGA